MRKHGLNERRIGALARLEAKRKPTQKDVEEIKILKERIRRWVSSKVRYGVVQNLYCNHQP